MNVRNLIKSMFLLSVGGAMTVAVPASAQGAQADKNSWKFYGDFRLRYESVSQDNALEDADAVTLRSRLGVKSATVNGFSGVLEIENSESIVDDFSVPPSDVRTGEFSVVADPDHTEIDQAFVQYANELISAKVGRQVFTLDNHRFVGHVGWRQDRQTYDAAVVSLKPSKNFEVNATYIDKRNRIFADDADVDSKDTLLNSSFTTSAGKLVAYAYLLEVDNGTDNSLDTYGVSFTGSQKVGGSKLLYRAEYATQDNNDAFDTDYFFLEGGAAFGGITAKIGYESLGSDDGQAGFATPLATLHKFNGWADQFLGTPSQGLEDLYVSFVGKLMGGNWVAAYHDFSSDVALDGGDDLGSEIDLVYSRKFGKNFSGGIKLANYSAGDAAFGKVDTDKFWLWAGASF